MATYAPLFAHVDGWQWRPDMIWYNNLRSFRTTSYYVQQMYSLNKGTNVLSLTMNGKPVAGNDDQDGLFASAVFDKEQNNVIVKVVNTGLKEQPIKLNLKGFKGEHYGAQAVFSASAPYDENSIDHPMLVVPKFQPLKFTGDAYETTIAPFTFIMYRINVTEGERLKRQEL